MKIKLIKLKCKNCEYEWEYSGSNPYYATCPKCLRKVKVEIKQNETL